MPTEVSKEIYVSTSCPWDFLPAAPLDFCERDLCGWIKEPANTWSNLGYVVVAIVILHSSAKERRPFQKLIGTTALLTGVCSAFYHASGTRLGMSADYSALFLGTGTMTALNVRRWLHWQSAAVYLTFLSTAASLITAFILVPDSGPILYLLAMPCCFIEVWLYFRDRGRTQYRFYLLAWLSVSIGIVFWWLDLRGSLCNPDNHLLSGHALWHLATATALIFFDAFYRQFEAVAKG